MAYSLTYKQYGERGLLIEWPPEISEAILSDILLFKQKIAQAKNTSIIELKHAYNALLIGYENAEMDFDEAILNLKDMYKVSGKKILEKSRSWIVPVCYDDEFAIDLETISKGKGLTKQEIIKRHSEVVYTVYFIGFLPGFLYLGGLDDTLAIPRKATPRLKIDKGAVAIGGNQTGIYPSESPGGWHIIGRTPVDFFNAHASPPCFAQAGDKIIFKPISQQKYHDIKVLVDAEVYQIESEVLDG